MVGTLRFAHPTKLDCIVALLLAMALAHVHIPAALFAPELCIVFVPRKSEGAGKTGWPHAPGALAQRKICASALTTGTGSDNRPSLRSGLRLISRSPR